MNKKFLAAKPEALICPFCGEKIVLNYTQNLSWYSNGESKLSWYCTECMGCKECCGHKLWIYFSGNDMHYFIDGVKGKLLISEIKEDPTNYQLTFDIDVPAHEDIYPYRDLNPLCLKHLFRKSVLHCGFIISERTYQLIQEQINLESQK